MRKIKILLLLKDLRIGNGVAACIMNYYKRIDDARLQIDFLLCRHKDSPYLEEINRKGGEVFYISDEKKRMSQKNRDFMNSVLERNYDIVHVNVTGITACYFLFLAKKRHIPVRVYHAHNPRETSSLKAWVRSMFYEGICVRMANNYIACSDSAGTSIFSKRKFTVLPNAMDINKYAYDTKERQLYRAEYMMQDKFVIGTVARIEEQKNPLFLIDIFKEVKSKQKNAILFWVGEGSMRGTVIEYAKKKGVLGDCLFVGAREDVNKLYSAMDVFVLPSKFEGFGLVFVEAQISGIKCFGSDKVPLDVKVTDNMSYINLSDNARVWAASILNYVKYERDDERAIIKKTAYNIENASEKLVDFYLNAGK